MPPAKVIKACVDVHPMGVCAPVGVGEMALDSSTFWSNGTTLTVAFDPAASVQLIARVMRSVAEWSDHANIAFRYVPG